MSRRNKLLILKNVAPAQSHFSYFFSNKSFSNSLKRHSKLFLCQMGRVERYLDQFICFQNEKKSKFKKCHAGTNSLFMVLFYEFILYFFINAFRILSLWNGKIWKIFWTIHLLTKKKKNSIAKLSSSRQLR